MENQVVVFELGGEQYGVNISAVESIIKMQPITKLPNVPAFVEGVTNLRGAVLPVISLRQRFGFSEEQETRDSRIIVVSMNGTKVGMVVNAVSEVLRIPSEAVEPPPAIVSSGVDASLITGIAKVGASNESAGAAQRLIILLEIGKVLSVQENEGLQDLASAR